MNRDKYPGCNYGLEWEPYTEYDKLEYDIRLKDGREIHNCYPNAGYFNSISKEHDGQKFHESDVDLIRITSKDQQMYGINENSLYGDEIPKVLVIEDDAPRIVSKFLDSLSALSDILPKDYTSRKQHKPNKGIRMGSYRYGK